VVIPRSKPTRVCGCTAHVVANTSICREHSAIELIAPGFPSSEPGQFVQLRCSDESDPSPRVVEWPTGGFPSLASSADWHNRAAFLRRPFSIGDQWLDENGVTHIVIISRTVGPGTAWLERLAPQETLNVTGPLGRGFKIPPDDVPIVLVGGGVGIPPLVYLARRLDESGLRDVTAVLGATTRDLLPVRLLSEPTTDGQPQMCAELAGAVRFPAVITTDDGSVGLRGVVTDALRKWHADGGSRSRAGGLVFACGPEAMLKAVAQATRELGLACQLCIERKMGCGLGTCLSCVVRVRDESRTEGWRWALTCSDGPVFDREELIDQQGNGATDVQ